MEQTRVGHRGTNCRSMPHAFAVEFELDTPIIMDRGIGLPGLLAWVLAERGEADPLPKVPLDTIEGILAGSDLFALGPTVDYHVSYVRSLRPGAMAHELALHDRRGRRLDQITLRDQRKNLLDTRRATSATTLVAFGAGHIDAVRDLLSGVDGLGAKRGSGYGAVRRLTVSPIGTHPHAGFADRVGNPLRAVPVAVWRRLNLPPRPTRNLVARLPGGRHLTSRASARGSGSWSPRRSNGR